MHPKRPLHLTVLALLCLLVLGAPVNHAIAETPVGEWYPVGPWDAHIFSLALDPSDSQTIYAGTLEKGLYKSTDGGNSWNRSGLDDLDVRCLAIDPANTQTIYANCTGYTPLNPGLYKSIDGGNVWNKMVSGWGAYSVETIAVDPTDTQTIYIGTWAGGIFKTTNGGVSWSTINTGLGDLNIQTLAIDASNSQTVYAGTNRNGVYKTSDGGALWSSVGPDFADMNSRNIKTIAIDPSNPEMIYIGTWNGVYMSPYGGGEWQSYGMYSLGCPFVTSLAIDPLNTSTIYAGTAGGGIFKSTDGIGSWTAVNIGLDNHWVEEFAIDSSSSQTIYAGTAHGAYKTTDSGGSWSGVNVGLGARDVISIAVDPVDKNIIYAGTTSDMFRSTDGGNTWSSGGLEGSVFSIAVAPSDSQIVYVGVDSGAYKSVDGGDSWGLCGPPILNVYSLAVDPSATETVYAGTWDGLYKSTDGGFWWDWIPSDPLIEMRTVYALAIDPYDSQTIYAGADSGIFKSDNEGLSWFDCSPLSVVDGLSIVIDPTDTQTIYAAGSIDTQGFVLKSPDRGRSWFSYWSCVSFSSIAIDPADTQTLYAGTEAGVYKSCDSGNTWNPFNDGLGNFDVRSVALGPEPTKTIYAGTRGGGVWRLDQAACTAPVANFGPEPQGYVGEPFTFADASSGAIDTWQWDFGDETTSSEQNPTHIFVSSGTYDVCLTVSGPCGTDTCCWQVAFEDRCEPLAKFSLSSTTAYAGEPITFTDESLGVIDTWQWYFGDPPFMGMSDEQNPTYTYQLPGTYSVCLEVYGPCGMNSVCQEITIYCVTPQAGFYPDPPAAYVGQQIGFTESSTGTIDTWYWEFGDGTTSTEQNPSHAYASRGTYNACLTASGPCGSDTTCFEILVEIECTPETPLPEAAFTASATEAYVGDSITFTNESTGIIDSWMWHFGDAPSNTSTELNPTHTYLEAGTYYVGLEVFGPCGDDTEFLEIIIHPPCTSPQAGFSPDTAQAYVRQQISFTDASTGTIDTWYWEFGDGTTSTEQNPSHAYASRGTYNTCLTVSSPCGSDTTCFEILVEIECTPETLPEAAFTASATEAYVGDSITFTNESTGIIDSWMWHFGDAPSNTSTELNPTHTYLEAGTYYVSLEVFGPCGDDTEFLEIIIHPPCTAPQAGFSPDTAQAYVGQQIGFTDASTGTIDTWYWEFGDGVSSVEQNPTHTYLSPGTYDVSLTVTGTCGSDTTSAQLVIQTALEMSCTPLTTSVFRGGNLRYTVTVTNNLDAPASFDYWTVATLPNGERYPATGGLFGPKEVTLAPYETRSVTLTQAIPLKAPPGIYTCTCYIGEYPGAVEAECQFDFQVTERWRNLGWRP